MYGGSAGSRRGGRVDEVMERKGEVALLRGPANWVRCARIVIRRSLSGRKLNIAAVYEKGMRRFRATRRRCSSNERFGVTRCSDGLSLVVDRPPHRAGAGIIGDGASPSLGVM